MPDYYVDSSTLVKRHVHETGTVWFQALTDPIAGNVIITARVSIVEVYSAFNRRVREAHLNPADYTQIVTDFLAICTTEYQIIELTPAVVNRAKVLLEHYPLRAYDAIQLASALITSDAFHATGLPPLTFLAADTYLLNVAQAEGLTTDNPNLHP